MSERYDFTYWPPRPHGIAPVTPVEPCEKDEVCRDLLYIPNQERKAAVYATGDWADIEDFWLETVREPSPRAIWSQTETDPITGQDSSTLRVIGRRHLQTSIYTFHQLGYEIAFYEACELAEEGDERHLEGQRVTRAQKFLFHHAFNLWDTDHSNRDILIARNVIMDIYEERLELPPSLSDSNRAILAKVALRWNQSIPNELINE